MGALLGKQTGNHVPFTEGAQRRRASLHEGVTILTPAMGDPALVIISAKADETLPTLNDNEVPSLLQQKNVKAPCPVSFNPFPLLACFWIVSPLSDSEPKSGHDPALKTTAQACSGRLCTSSSWNHLAWYNKLNIL